MPGPIMNCTRQSPMPADRDQMGQEWYHHGARPMDGQPPLLKEGDSQMWRCPNCGHQFPIFARKFQGIAEAQARARDMRSRGWHA